MESLPGPTPGTYRIRNHQSKWTVSTETNDGIAQPGDPIKTVKGAQHNFPYPNTTLIVSTDGTGLYTFRNQKTKMFIGMGHDEHGHAVAVWTMAAQYWDVDRVQPGKFSISFIGDAESFWYDCSEGGNPFTEVLLKESMDVDQYYWYFVAA
ncbi:hypothetical protein CVT24_006620 [Panaeolus cyanescens]|uniref:Uncharacterized protein n=1 Tax=Panaeolus cyanescens TaxID=181874 RepID=A0A409YS92_9AGAR|nr:hypothetical protein CVT24_006620 [Panaeolus cyanescens]